MPGHFSPSLVILRLGTFAEMVTAAFRHTCPYGRSIRVASEREELNTRIDSAGSSAHVEKFRKELGKIAAAQVCLGPVVSDGRHRRTPARFLGSRQTHAAI